MSSTHDDLVRQVQGTATELGRLVELYSGPEGCTPADIALLADWGAGTDGLEVDEDGEYDAETVSELAREVLYASMLELVEHGKRTPGGEWESTHVVAVFYTGGPHVELDTGKRAVVGYWGGDRSSWGVSSDVVDYFEQMVEL